MTDMLEQLIKKVNTLQTKVAELERLERPDMARNQGWIGGDWQKDPIRLGYSSQLIQHAENLSLAAGTNNIVVGTPSAGTIWVITHIACRYSGTVTNVVLQPKFRKSSVDYFLARFSTLVSTVWQFWSGYLIADENTSVQLTVLSATLNDDAEINVIGWVVDINQ